MPLCGEVICILNLRITCLQCILLLSSFHFFKKNSRSSEDEKRKREGDMDVEVEIDEVDEVDEKR